MTSIKFNSVMFWATLITFFLTVHLSEEFLERTRIKFSRCNGDDCDTSSTGPTNFGSQSDVLMCYQCKDCNYVNSSTVKVKCGFAKCCYVAFMGDGGEMFAVRGCSLPNKPCNEICEYIKQDHFKIYVNGSFGYCKACSADGCNNYQPPKVVQNTVICYDCRNCNKVTSLTPTIPCPQANCCYTAVLKDYKFEDGFAVRGCYDQNCSDTCMQVQNKHMQMYPAGMFNFCVPCGSGDGDGCNNNIYNPSNVTRKTFDENKEMNCFKCDDCEDVSTHTSKIYCESNCCYSKMVGGRYQRGCVSDTSGSCEEYCEKQNGDFCDTCGGNKCNILRFRNDSRKSHSVFKRTSYVYCYECVGCYSIAGDDDNIVDCPDKCCLMIWWTEHDESTMIRMCVKLNGRRCQDYCDHTRDVVRDHDPNGIVQYCEDCSIDKCNYFEINRYHAVAKHYSSIKCYTCKDCEEEVNVATGVCMSGCCYSAAMQDNGKAMTVRACAKLLAGQSCYTYCEVAEAEYKKIHHGGEVIKCTSCTTDRCNTDKSSTVLRTAHIHEQLDVTEPTHDFIYCYECRNCKVIPTDVKRVRCLSKCCYSAMLYFGKNKAMPIRECVKLNLGSSCGTYCTQQMQTLGSMGYCRVCETDNCNNEMLYPQLGVTSNLPINNFKCYICKNCDIISPNTPMSNCNTKCCVTLVRALHGITTSHRSCPRLEGIPCEQYCSYVATTFKILSCEVCNTNKCNRMPAKVTSVVKPRKAHKTSISCYGCRNCNRITAETPIAKCNNKCCYSAILTHDDGSVVIKRNCTSAPCKLFCIEVRKEHASAHPVGAEHFYCKVCTSNNCNNEDLNTIVVPVRRQIGTPITCYSCINCYEISEKDTETCPNGCCYTATWTEFGRKMFARLCADFNTQPCSQYCNHLARLFENSTDYGELHHCETCTDTNCNSEPVPKPTTPPDDINCYNCTDCNQATDATPTIACPSNCCYSQLKFLDDGSRVTIRQCAKISPGTACHQLCSHAEELHQKSHPKGSFSYCKVCTYDACNKQRLDTAITGQPNKPPITCYNCTNCHTTSNQTSVECPTGCCFTVIWKHFEETSLLRDCINPDETPCAEYCKNFQLAVLHNDPSGSVLNCDICKTNKCNNLLVATPQQTGLNTNMCYDCKNCNELVMGDVASACLTSCCYATITRNDFNTITSERGCASFAPGVQCANICDTITSNNKNSHLTTVYCTNCTGDRCNHINLDPLIAGLTKALATGTT